MSDKENDIKVEISVKKILEAKILFNDLLKDNEEFKRLDARMQEIYKEKCAEKGITSPKFFWT